MKNIMYFRLKQGEEAAPLRDIALENFPNVNLYETDIQADRYGENDVLNYIIKQVKDGKYNNLYIKSIEELSRNDNESIEIINDIAAANPDFVIVLKGGACINPKVLMNKIFHTMVQTFAKIERNTDGNNIEPNRYTDFLNVIIESDGKKITVELPCDEAMIEEELKNAGMKLDNASDVKFTVDTSLPDKFKRIIEKACVDKGIYAANDISSALLTYGMELDEEIMAVIEYANADTTEKVMHIMNDTDGFNFIDGAKSLEDIGRYWVTNDMETEIESEIDKYMDYETLGKDIMFNYNGKFVENGCVINRKGVEIEKLFKINDDLEEGMNGIQNMQ